MKRKVAMSPPTPGPPVTEDEAMGYYNLSSEEWDSLSDDLRQRLYDTFCIAGRCYPTLLGQYEAIQKVTAGKMRLIAQAPALLRLVNSMLYMMDGGDKPSLDERDKWLDEARALLAQIEKG